MNNPINAVVAVAKKMLAGELAFRTGPPDAAFALLEEAILLEEALVYDEPWGWMQPVRHALGALLLEEAGRASSPDKAAAMVAYAEQVYVMWWGCDRVRARLWTRCCGHLSLT
jgi:hypothetical protein